MSANVETMFSVRETPWYGLGRIVMDAPASREALGSWLVWIGRWRAAISILERVP